MTYLISTDLLLCLSVSYNLTVCHVLIIVAVMALQIPHPHCLRNLTSGILSLYTSVAVTLVFMSIGVNFSSVVP